MAQNSQSNKAFPGNAIGIESANDDQRTSKGRNTNPGGGVKYDEGKKHAHDNSDVKDQRSIANRLAAAEKENAEAKKYDSKSHDPTEAAVMHGNEPSRGAKIDKMLQEEDEERMRQKGA